MTSPNTKNAMLKAVNAYNLRQLESIFFFFPKTPQHNKISASQITEKTYSVCVCLPVLRIVHEFALLVQFASI